MADLSGMLGTEHGLYAAEALAVQGVLKYNDETG
jgi:hypothetical protein